MTHNEIYRYWDGVMQEAIESGNEEVRTFVVPAFIKFQNIMAGSPVPPTAPNAQVSDTTGDATENQEPITKPFKCKCGYETSDSLAWCIHADSCNAESPDNKPSTLQEGEGWISVENPPNKGNGRLSTSDDVITSDGNKVATGRYCTDLHKWYGYIPNPTHWMPLPPAPQTK